MIVLFVIIAILVIIALLRLGADIRYDESGLYVSVFAGPVRITVLPGQDSGKEVKRSRRKRRKIRKTVREKWKGIKRAERLESFLI